MTGSWLRNGDATTDAPLRLFCFPHAGGGGGFFRPWRALLPPQIEVCPVILPGREARIEETPYTRMADLLDPLCEGLAPYLDRPYALFGHSMGAAVAYEVARRFDGDPVRAPRRLLVSGRRAPHLAARRRAFAGLDDADFLQAVAQLGGIPEEVLRHRELVRMFLPGLRADFAVNETYRPSEGPPLTCPVAGFTGERDPEVTPLEMGLWNRTTKGPFRMTVYEGNHFYLKDLPVPLRAGLTGELEEDVRPAAA
ncbi:alpha/beta fold hydrolase [Streptomyces sp. RKAG293]|uniref:thioesterase II family protein n=1 Tax=Streptomyces sp. RKAG293 TaxID=2893403 RepID=UPI0020346223|nr:alpha/beta fold hydrolase [Streptomyces sp. RKAG293]MCM2416780.1 alpha/beta fold hydrolase [Streptomyces sp. RKAG293]